MQWLRQSHGLTLAVMAGVMASLGSTFAKLAMSGDIVLSYCLLLAGNDKCQQVSYYHNLNHPSSETGYGY